MMGKVIKPYETTQELLDDYKIHGPYVISRNSHIFYLITSIKPPLISSSDARDELYWNRRDTLPSVELGGHRHNTVSYEDLLRLYRWQDGHLCGKQI